MNKGLFKCIVFAGFFLLPVVLFADVPNEILYQGKLREYGQLVNATKNIQFKLFDAQNGGTQIGLSYGGNLPVTNGLFSYVLNVSGVDWYQGNYWIETIVENKILTPREKLTASPYALHSRTSEGIHKKSGTTIDFTIGAEKRASIANDGTMSCIVGGTSYYMVPRGAIIMWSGTIAGIPSGWALCDGANGTPDLRDRFILSVANASENPGAADGSHSVTLQVENLPSHTHTGATSLQSVDHAHNGSTGYAGSHAHSYGYHGNVINNDDVAVNSGYHGAWRNEVSANTDSQGSHAHAFTTDGATANHAHSFTTNATGTSIAFDNRPAFFKLAFIMKL